MASGALRRAQPRWAPPALPWCRQIPGLGDVLREPGSLGSIQVLHEAAECSDLFCWGWHLNRVCPDEGLVLERDHWLGRSVGPGPAPQQGRSDLGGHPGGHGDCWMDVVTTHLWRENVCPLGPGEAFPGSCSAPSRPSSPSSPSQAKVVGCPGRAWGTGLWGQKGTERKPQSYHSCGPVAPDTDHSRVPGGAGSPGHWRGLC